MPIELPILNRSHKIRKRKRERDRGGFTLVESLAALLFLAIVLPVALQGLALANRSAVVAERKQIATRLLDNLINERSATGQLMTGASTGNFAPDYPEYSWKMETLGWTESLMREVIFVASYNVQGREHYVTLATLVAQE